MTPKELEKLARDGNERNQEMYDNLVAIHGREAADAISTMANITLLMKAIVRIAGPSAMPMNVLLAQEMGRFTWAYFRRLGLDPAQTCKDMDMFIRARELS